MHKLLTNPAVCSVVHLLATLGLSFAKAEVREKLGACPTFPSLSLEDIGRTLDDLGIASVAVEANDAVLDRVPLPALAFVTTASVNGSAPASLYVVLESADTAGVRLTHPVLGAQKLDREQFRGIWSGVLLLVDLDGSSALFSADALRREREENERFEARVSVLNAFLTAAECEHLISYAETRKVFSRSEILFEPQGGAFDEVLKASRTSSSAVLDDRTDACIAAIRERAAGVLHCAESELEPLQCVRYLSGEEFRPHFDADEELLRNETLLVYLNDDFVGGETVFPEIQLHIAPCRGTAVRFPNLSHEGRVLPQALHAGAPVLSGTKYVCNIWVARH